ncbi:OmpA family protein [Saccharomonospora sp. NPDC046836]|uniref:OmpA family protein n=1 Tax=Saccharomonospora sp. NPDC046836 TaxID=3156921 RepID=UPI0033CF5AFE
MSGNRGRLWLVPLVLLVTGMLAFAATWTGVDRIESDLLARTRSALAGTGLPVDGVSFNGRDATMYGVPLAQTEWAAEVVRGVEGVRAVAVVSAEPTAEQDSPQDVPQRLQSELDSLLAGRPITFQPNSAVLTQQGSAAVSAVGELLAGTPTGVTFEVGGHVARIGGGDPRTARLLSEQRADAVARQLIASGIANDRVTSVGYGDTRPLTPDGDTSVDRRVEITVR